MGGGKDNIAGGFYSTVPGGHFNTASMIGSFAASLRAKAIHNGAFVWSDSSAPMADFASTADNQFNVRAAGGTRIFSDAAATVGVQLAPGGNSWSILSDRNLKENFTTVDGQEILRRLSLIPIMGWNLRSQDPSIRHLGPVAQDFYAAFSLGESNRYISTSDEGGIALISIQALYQMVQEKDQEIGKLTQEMNDLQQRLNALEQAVDQLKAK